MVAVVADAEVVVRGQFDALGHVWGDGEGGHGWRSRERGAVVLEGLEALEAFLADVLHFFAGGVEFGDDFGANAAHDVGAFCVRGVGGRNLGGDGEEFKLGGGS